MTLLMKRVLFWAPRLLAVTFAGFLALFALDVFSEPGGLGETLLALLVHLAPTGAVLVVLALAWRREWIGAVLFTALGLLYLSQNLAHSSWILAISVPLFAVAVLFLLNWIFRRQLRPRS